MGQSPIRWTLGSCFIYMETTKQLLDMIHEVITRPMGGCRLPMDAVSPAPGPRQVPASPLLQSTIEHNNNNNNRHYYLLCTKYDA